jgi:hypothetical protein
MNRQNQSGPVLSIFTKPTGFQPYCDPWLQPGKQPQVLLQSGWYGSNSAPPVFHYFFELRLFRLLQKNNLFFVQFELVFFLIFLFFSCFCPTGYPDPFFL